MKLKFQLFVLTAFIAATLSAAPDLSDLMNPDDIMLRKPVKEKPVLTVAEKRAADADVEKRFSEARAKAEAKAEAKMRARLDAEAARRIAAKKAAEETAAEVAAAKKAAEEAVARKAAKKAVEEAAAKKAAADAEELKVLRAQIAAEKKAREQAEKEAAAAREKAAAEAKAATEAKTAKNEAEAAMSQAVQKVRDERTAREKAEAGRVAAEARAAADRAAAEKAVEAKAAAEKKAAYLRNPDPDERPQPRKKLQASADQTDVTASVAVGPVSAGSPEVKKKAEKKRTGREAVITADRTDYDRKEGVILFDRNVYVDDEQYQMHADRLFVFLDGTNDLKRLVAIGHVAITNEEKTAACNRAVYTKQTSKIVMYGDDSTFARLHDASKKGGTVEGRKITFWLNSEEMQVEESSVRMPTGSLKAGNPKDLFNKAK